MYRSNYASQAAAKKTWKTLNPKDWKIGECNTYEYKLVFRDRVAVTKPEMFEYFRAFFLGFELKNFAAAGLTPEEALDNLRRKYELTMKVFEEKVAHPIPGILLPGDR